MTGSKTAPETGPSAFRMGRAWIELDTENLKHNVSALRRLLPDKCRLMPAVKANAYGHGAVEICRELNKLGVRDFCVATVLEGAELRENGVKGEILVLGYTHPEMFYLLREHALTQTIIDLEYAEALNSYGTELDVHIKVDTGMRRLGERAENVSAILRIFDYGNLNVTGIFTHLCADDGDRESERAFSRKQITAFTEVLSGIKASGRVVPKAHLQGSYGVFNHRGLAFDYARVGIALYGMLSTGADTEKCIASLRPVLSLKARVAMTKALAAGEAIGYGLTFTAVRDMRIAVLSIGYADGIPRGLSNGVGHVLIDGQKAPVAGRICMDQMMVDITGIENVRQGDIAVIIGSSGKARISACDIAEQTGTISNEILSRLGGRLERMLV